MSSGGGILLTSGSGSTGAGGGAAESFTAVSAESRELAEHALRLEHENEDLRTRVASLTQLVALQREQIRVLEADLKSQEAGGRGGGDGGKLEPGV